MKKRIVSIITALAMILVLIPATALPVSAATYTATNQASFESAMAQAKDGDTIQINGSFVLKNSVSNNDSLVIDKAVTIQGGELTFWYGGILLAADVTFKDITLGLGSNVRNALMANGHTLTLNNVKKAPGMRDIHLFCGGLTGGTQAGTAQGSHGQIIIMGNTDLGEANIYAGSISTDGKSNCFDKPATVTIENSIHGCNINHIYASGALETYTSPDDWFDVYREIAPPTPSAEKFPVSGNVTFNLYGSVVKTADGNTGTGSYADITYDGMDFLNETLVLTNIGGLNVRSGNLIPAAGSGFAGNNASLSVGAGAILGLNHLDSEVQTGRFDGGGSLLLKQDQKLIVTGNVSGSTIVGIGSIFHNHSLGIPQEDHVYIDAFQSENGNFVLASNSNRPDIDLLLQENRTWKAVGGQLSVLTIVNDFSLTSAAADPSDMDPDPDAPSDTDPVLWFAALPFEYVNYAPNSAHESLVYIPLEIKVNREKATDNNDGSYTCASGSLLLSIAGDSDGEELQIERTDGNSLTGSYQIEITIPAENSGTGQPITRTATLTVKSNDGKAEIPVPKANTGLVYNGQAQEGVPAGLGYTLTGASGIDADSYTATATLTDGFQWTDGGTDPVNIPWSITPAEAPAIPAGLAAAAPSTYGADDGKITGTTAEMEYADNAGFTSPKNCTEGKTDVPAGDYYIRLKKTSNYMNPGDSVLVTVPNGPAVITSVAVASTDHKINYKVGEALDVTGLVLTVSMSNGGSYTVPAAAKMVSGFNSAAPAASQTLTISYGGKTATYAISITGNTSTGGDSGGSSSGGGSSGGGGGGGGISGGGSSSNPSTDSNESAGLPLEEKSKHFTDIDGHWAKDAIDFVTARGIFSGTSSATFSPDDAMTRGMIAVVLYNLEGKPDFTAQSGLTDVEPKAWYTNGIHWMIDAGIASGYGNGRFGTEDFVTREQLVTFLYHYAEIKGYTTDGSKSDNSGSTAALSGFPDRENVSDYAAGAMNWAVENGLIAGSSSGLLLPQDNATRAQVAAIFRHFAENVAK